MAKFNIQFTDPDTGSEVLELLFSRLAPGSVSEVKTVRVRNVSGQVVSGVSNLPAVTLTGCRLVVRLITGIVDKTGLSAAVLARRCRDEQGNEAVDEKWVEARLAGVGSFKPIGGPYGNGASSANYLDVPDLDPNDTQDLEIRVNVPATPTTPDLARVRLGLAYPDPEAV